MKVQLVDVGDLQASAYNPRKADAQRLDLVELSLRKLGFLIPIYATPTGEIISGNQRHFVASRMGITRVPVVRLPAWDLERRKYINILFNRGTNDMDPSDTAHSITEALLSLDVEALADPVPDKDGDDLWPCLEPEAAPVDDLTSANAGRWKHYARSIARVLDKYGVEVPVVTDSDGVVVNGIGRLEWAAECGRSTIPTVVVSNDEARLARALLNLLSMDFDLHSRYADELRHNAFRRGKDKRERLGKGYIYEIHKGPLYEFDIEDHRDRDRWVRKYGRCILDFGAGTMDEVRMLRAQGIDAVAFEPFVVEAGVGKPTREATEPVAREFLDRIEAGVEFDSIFVNAVLNSVPFEADRQHVVVLTSELATSRTRLYGYAASEKHFNYRHVLGKHYVSKHGFDTFRLDYEPRVKLASIAEAPKVQKYHTPTEWYGLWKLGFDRVRVFRGEMDVHCVCESPRSHSWETICKSIEFEFDVRYHNGKKLGLVERAKQAFQKRREFLHARGGTGG